jgi:hypothetical protein
VENWSGGLTPPQPSLKKGEQKQKQNKTKKPVVIRLLLEANDGTTKLIEFSLIRTFIARNLPPPTRQ